jgi:hypothetical protein
MSGKRMKGEALRVTTEHAKTTETERLIERDKDHPAGPGITVVTTYESKKK